MSKVSFIVPSYNSFKTIHRTLDSIFSLHAIDQIQQVIVVDSSDDVITRRLIRRYHHPKLHLIELSQKTAPAETRNRGARDAEAELLCFIDSDVFLDEYWLDHILTAYEDGCSIGGGAVGVSDFQDKNPLALAQFYLQFNESLKVGKIRPMTMLPACNMFIQRQLFEKVGGFPDLRASEDVVFCLKCAPFSPIWFVPEALCFHIFREEQNSFFQNQMILGQYIMVYRRLCYKKWYYQKPWACILLPAFLLIKMMRIISRIMKAGQIHLKKFVFSFPMFLLGLFFWAKGFYQEAIIASNVKLKET